MKQLILIFVFLFFAAGCADRQKQNTESNIKLFFYDEQELKVNKSSNSQTENTEIPDAVSDVKDKKTVLMFGRVPYADVREMYERHNPLLNYLSEKLNRPIRLKFYPNYSKLIDGIIAGEIQIAWMGSVSYVGAIDKLRSSNRVCIPVVKAFRRNKAYLQSDIIVRKDSGINSLEELEGKKIAFLDPKSTAGFILPFGMLENRNINIAHLTDKNFLRHYGNIVKAVQLGKFDAGATFEDAYHSYLNADEIEQVKLLSRSETVPFEPVCVVGSYESSRKIADKLQEILLEINDPKILDNLEIQKFITANADEYNFLSNLIKKVLLKNEKILE